MIKLCIFDMDGLLVDSERYFYLNNGMEITRQLGYPLSEEFFRSLMGVSWDLYAKKISKEAGEGFPIDEYLRILWERIEYSLANDKIPLMPGAKELLDYCKQNSIKMAVATSTHYDKAIACLKNTEIYDYFDYVMTGDRVSKGKPDPEIFLKTIEHFGIDKKEVLVLEDGHNGAKAAIDGGCRLIIVEDLARLEKEDREKAEFMPKNLAEVIDYIKEENEGTSSI